MAALDWLRSVSIVALDAARAAQVKNSRHRRIRSLSLLILLLALAAELNRRMEVMAEPAHDAAPAVPTQSDSADIEMPSQGYLPLKASVTEWEWIWVGGNQSLLFRAIGAAEGTRGPDGGFNPAYQGHKDPGNGVWNIGTFSYQHGAPDPEAADAKQVERLRAFESRLYAQAQELGIVLTKEVVLNALDLWNQSPRAAEGGTGRFGSRSFLANLDDLIQVGEAKNGDYSPENIIKARTRSYLNHEARWTATGLNANPNTGWDDAISRGRVWRDQERRYNAISRAIQFSKDAGAIPEGF